MSKPPGSKVFGTGANRFAAAGENVNPVPQTARTSLGIQEVNENVSQRSTAAGEITGSSAVAVEAMKDFRNTDKSAAAR